MQKQPGRIHSSMDASKQQKWFHGVAGVLLDVTGVLYNSGTDGGSAINGSVTALKKLKASGLPYRLCSNESTQDRAAFASKLRGHGFPVEIEDIVCPAPAMARRLIQEGLRPHLLVHPDVLSEFENVDKSNPNCVVIGDAQHYFTYEALNTAFRLLLSLPIGERKLFAMGQGKFYSENGELVLDVGSYGNMLAFACDTAMEVCGKPNKIYFNSAIEMLGVPAEKCVMVGDDIISDVGGAQKLGMRGVQVRTGKFRPSDEPHPSVTPDAYVDNLSEAVSLILQGRETQ